MRSERSSSPFWCSSWLNEPSAPNSTYCNRRQYFYRRRSAGPGPILIAISAVVSPVTIISIYREGGILKRLRATPLRPQTILTAHVIVNLLHTAATLSLMVLAGKRYCPVGIHVPLVGFTIALLISKVQHLVDWLSYRQHRAHGAVRAADRCHHEVSDDRCFRTFRADCVGAAAAARRGGNRALTYAVSLLGGIWKGDPWSAFLSDVAALALVFLVCTALSAKVFRWE